MKIDLHCHSKFSKRPTLWLMQKLGCPESFTEPLELYHRARQMGMTAVTITDHNVIEGALEIAHLPNALMGCEYTTYFPEDRCKVHILAYGFSEAQHRDLSEARENIYDFTKYLQVQKIWHVCAHPFFGPNDRLSAAHLEKLALLYKNWEWNGDQNPHMNAAMQALLEELTPETMDRLANRHGIAPAFPEPWKKNLTGGSDDHSSLNLARTFTEVGMATTLAELWAGIEQGHARIHCTPSNPAMFARNVYGIAYQFYKSRFGLERYVSKDLLLRFLDRTLQARPEPEDPWLSRLYLKLSSYRRARSSAGTLVGLARQEAEKLIRKDPQLMSIVSDGVQGDLDQKWFEFVNELSNDMLSHVEGALVQRVIGARIFDIFHSLGSAGALYALIAPFFVSFSHYSEQRRFSQEVLRDFDGGRLRARKPGRTRIANFTDTYADVNGVALTLRHELKIAQKLDLDYTLVVCGVERPAPQRGVLQFSAVGDYALPEYSELRLLVPPFLQMLQTCYEEDFTHIHIATPGPVGLAGLAIARILQLPVSGTYHTALPQYAKTLTEDAYVEETMWRYMIWFYDQMDEVYVPSQATAEELAAKGLPEAKVRVYPRGVDTLRFDPEKRNLAVREQYCLGDAPTLLYVGRVSREKNLPLLVDAFRLLLERGVQTGLVVVGDGPYRAEMEAALAGTPAVFTGYLEGEALTVLYASCDILIFPSTTDTFGNVVLEAQASGIPAIVSGQGGPRENVKHEETGLILAEMSASAWASAAAGLLEDEALRRHLGTNAREWMETRSFEGSFRALWEMYTGEAGKSTPKSARKIPWSFGALEELAVI